MHSSHFRQLGWDDGSTNGRIRIMIVRPLWSLNEAKRYPLNHSFYKNICSQLKEAFSEWISVVSVTPIEVAPEIDIVKQCINICLRVF
jgi:hypothetical protein